MDPKINLVSKLVQTRNDVLHSATLELEDDQLKGYVDDMIALLQDKKKLLNDPDAQKAVGKLKQLKDESFIISSKDEVDIFNESATMKETVQKLSESQSIIESRQRALETRQHLFSTIQETAENKQKAVETRQDAVENSQKAVETRQYAVENTQKAVETRQYAAENTQKTVETRQDLVENRQKAVETRQESVENKQKTVETRQDAVENRQIAVETRQVVVENKQKTVETRQDAAENRQNAVETRQDAVENNQKTVEIRQDTVEHRQNAVETRQDAVEIKQKTVETRQDAVESGQNAVETRQDAVENRQNAVETRQDAVEIKQEVVETRQDSIENRQEAVEIHQTTVELTLGELKAAQIRTTAQLNKKVNDLHLEFPAFKHKLDDTRNMKESHKQQIQYFKRKQDLQERLCRDYENHLSTIPVSPVLDEIEARVEDVFVELVICDDLIHETKTSENRIDTGKKVEGYRDILYKNGKTSNNIYVIGDAGMGKTTWCMKMLSTWVIAYKKKTGKITKTSNLTADEKIMSEFDVVLFLSLRHAASHSNILDMVQDLLFEDDSEIMDLAKEVLKKEPHKCLIILDGLDEWSPPNNQQSSQFHNPDLPGRNGLHGCTVLTTTRPWKLEAIELKTKEIDRAVIIQGIMDQDLLAEIVVNVLNEHHAKEMGDDVQKKTLLDFKTNVWKTFHNWSPSFMKVPLLLVFMVCIWFDDGKLETTLAANFSRFIEYLIKKADGDKKSRKQSKLSNRKKLMTLKSQWSKSADRLPKCLQIHKTCNDYSELLLKLSSLASDSLFEVGKENTLVFTAALLESRFTEEELDVAVNIGILSQSKAVGSKTLARMTSLSFLHKTLQEYFAALHLVCLEEQEMRDAMEKCKQFCTSNTIGEVENVLLFVCGMKAQTASDISHIVAAILNTCDDQTWPIWADRGLILYGNAMLKFVNEAYKTLGFKQMTEYPIYTYSLNIELGSESFMYQMILLAINCQQLTLLYIDFRETFVKLDGGLNIPEKYKRQNLQLSELPLIGSLTHLNYIQRTQVTMRLLPDVFCRMSQLRRLEMCDIFNASPVMMSIDLTNCQNLQELKCKSMAACKVTISSTNLQILYLHNVRSCTVSAYPNTHINSPVSSSVIKNDVMVKTAITCTKTQHSNVTLALSPGQINEVQLSDCASCEFVIKGNTGQGIKSSEEHIMDTIQSICAEKLTECKVEICTNDSSTCLILRESSECSLSFQCQYSEHICEEHIMATIRVNKLTKCKVKFCMTNSLTNLTLVYCMECSISFQCQYSEQDIRSSEEHMSTLQNIHIEQLTKCTVEICMNDRPNNLILGKCSECSLSIHCPYLQHLSLGNLDEMSDEIKELLRSLIFATKLQVIGCQKVPRTVIREVCSYYQPTDAANCSAMATCPTQNQQQPKYLTHLRVKLSGLEQDAWEEFALLLPTLNNLMILELYDIQTPSMMHSLQHLTHLRHFTCQSSSWVVWEAFGDVLPMLTQLEALELTADNYMPLSVIHSLQSLTHLRHLTLLQDYHQAANTPGTLPIILPIQLETLKLYDVVFRNQEIIKLSTLHHLKKITLNNYLNDVSLTDTQWRIFIDSVPDTRHTLEVVLEHVEMKEDTINYIQSSTRFPSQVWARYFLLEPKYNVTLKTLTQLKVLELIYMPQSVIYSLKHLTHLKHLTLQHYNQVADTPKTLQITLPIQLETLKLSESRNLEIINLSTLHHLKKFTLLCVRLTDAEWRIFIDSVPNTRHTLEVVLEHVEMKEDTINYIKSSTRFPSQVWKRYNFLQLRCVQHRYDATLKTV